MGHILRVQPVFKEMIWGGHKLKEMFMAMIFLVINTGECWAIFSSSKMEIVQLVMENLQVKTLSIVLWDEHRELIWKYRR